LHKNLKTLKYIGGGEIFLRRKILLTKIYISIIILVRVSRLIGSEAMFEINLEALFDNYGMSKTFEKEFELLEDGIENPIKVKCTISNNTGIVSLNGKIEADYFAICDRCAKEVKRHYSIDMEHTFVAELQDETNDEFLLVQNNRFDLEELVKEDVIFALPYKFLCKDDCKGICLKCGKNLNEGSCNCEEEIDPRMAPLLSLLEDK